MQKSKSVFLAKLEKLFQHSTTCLKNAVVEKELRPFT